MCTIIYWLLELSRPPWRACNDTRTCPTSLGLSPLKPARSASLGRSKALPELSRMRHVRTKANSIRQLSARVATRAEHLALFVYAPSMDLLGSVYKFHRSLLSTLATNQLANPWASNSQPTSKPSSQPELTKGFSLGSRPPLNSPKHNAPAIMGLHQAPPKFLQIHEISSNNAPTDRAERTLLKTPAVDHCCELFSVVRKGSCPIWDGTSGK